MQFSRTTIAFQTEIPGGYPKSLSENGVLTILLVVVLVLVLGYFGYFDNEDEVENGKCKRAFSDSFLGKHLMESIDCFGENNPMNHGS